MTATLIASESTSLIRTRVGEILHDDLGVKIVEQDVDGDLEFRYQSGAYLICFDEQDCGFLRISLPAFYAVDPRVRHTAVLEACAEATRSVKLVKVFPMQREDGTQVVSAIAEVLVHDHEFLHEELIGRCLEAINVAVRCLFESMAVAGADPESVEVAAPVPKKRKRH